MRRPARLRRLPGGPVLRRRRLQPVRREARDGLRWRWRRGRAVRRPTCQSLGIDCGYTGDGCGGVLIAAAAATPHTAAAAATTSAAATTASPADGGSSGCTPTTCAQLGYTCGVAADGCGGVLNCGTCANPQFCGGGGFDKCGGDNGLAADGGVPCTPTTCASSATPAASPPTAAAASSIAAAAPTRSTAAAAATDQCGGNNGLAADGSVACTPETCSSLGYTCGVAGDGCGGTLNCGSCANPQYCGGGGFNQCGGNNGFTADGGVACTPKTCAQLGYTCGITGDGCGGSLSCGSCTNPQYCGGGGFNQCGGNDGLNPDGGVACTPDDVRGPRLQLRPGRRRLRRPPQLRLLHQSAVLRRRRLRPVRRQQRPHRRRRRRVHAQDVRAAQLHLRRGGRRLRQPAQLRHVHLAAVLRRRRLRPVRAVHRLRVRRRRDDQRDRLRLRPGQQPARLQRARLRPHRRRPDAARRASTRRPAGAPPRRRYASAYTGIDGNFTLQRAGGSSLTLVVQLGKWQRAFTQRSPPCTTNTLAAHLTLPSTTRRATSRSSPSTPATSTRWSACSARWASPTRSSSIPPSRRGCPPRPGACTSTRAATTRAAPSSTTRRPRRRRSPRPRTVMNSYDVILFPCQGGQADYTSKRRLAQHAGQPAQLRERRRARLRDALTATPCSTRTAPPRRLRGQRELGGEQRLVERPVHRQHRRSADVPARAGARQLAPSGVVYGGTLGQIPVNVIRNDFTSAVAPAQEWMYTTEPAGQRPGAHGRPLHVRHALHGRRQRGDVRARRLQRLPRRGRVEQQRQGQDLPDRVHAPAR